MPELPEVETIVRGLNRKIVNQRINGFDFEKSFSQRILPSVAAMRRTLTGNKIKTLSRRGKLIIMKLANAKYLFVHLKMTGQMVYLRRGGRPVCGGHNVGAGEKLPNKFTRLTLSFANGGKLYFNDIRKFGYWQLTDEHGLQTVLRKFGVEPVEKQWTAAYFQALCKRFPKQKIKNLLMKQEVIAGLGNIYSDEVCFHAGVRPLRLAGDLTENEQRKLWRAARQVLRDGIKHGGTTFSDFVNCEGQAGGYQKKLMVYGRGGELCKKCKKEKIIKIKISGRSSCYCRRCQS